MKFNMKKETSDEKAITKLWMQYQKGKDYLLQRGVFEETDKNYRMYNEDQWYGVESGPIDPIVLNIIKPTVKYKVGTINANLFAINYSAENYEDEVYQKEAEKVCELLNKHVARVWENDYMDYKIRKVSKRACIDSEGIMYFDMPGKDPKAQIISKTNVYFGDENEQDIQEQPYIIITTRKPLLKVKEYAKNICKLSNEEIENIISDNDTTTQSGDSSKYELEDKIAKTYPEDICNIESTIEGMSKDLQNLLNFSFSKDKFFNININGINYSDKKEANEALNSVIKDSPIDEDSQVKIGNYVGFDMYLGFNFITKNYYITLKNNHNYIVELGNESTGNITRISNELDRINSYVSSHKERLQGLKNQLELAKKEVEKPFPQENELSEMIKRLKEVDIELKMDENINEVIDDSKSENISQVCKKDYER